MIELVDTFEISKGITALVTQTDDISTFESTKISPAPLAGTRGWVPWGDGDVLPAKIMEFVGKNEVLSANTQFNISSIYGQGIQIKQRIGGQLEDVTDPQIISFLENNDLDNFLLEQITDLVFFYNIFPEIILNKAGKKILQINSKEACFSRWETMNPNNGVVENHFYSGGFIDCTATKDNITSTPVLDKRNPLDDLRSRMSTPKYDDRRFIIPVNFPTPSKTYYQRPYWWSVFESGWFDISMLVPAYKKALMTNQMTIKYHVQLHRDYFTNIFDQERITDKTKQDERKKKEIQNLRDYLSGSEKTGKTLISQISYNAEGKEIPMIKIDALENKFKGNDYLDDTDVAVNMLSYAQGVHPNLIGASPGKSGSLSGTDKRELFTIKQALVKPLRNIILRPLNVIKAFNKWPDNTVITIPDIALTTLDQGTDAKIVTPIGK